MRHFGRQIILTCKRLICRFAIRCVNSQCF